MEIIIRPDSKGGAASRRFKRLEDNIKGSRETLAEVAELIAEGNKKLWGRNVKLQPSTIEWKDRYGQSQEPLVETGQMKAELTEARRGIKVLTSSELIFGSTAKTERGATDKSLARAYVQQHGSKNMKKHIVLRVAPETRAEISDLVIRSMVADD